jgi:DNA-directed RNA polymerase subunit omega
MIEDFKNTELVEKVGGKFKLTSLIQKRMKEILEGSRPLIENTQGMSVLQIVVKEILQDKITIDFDACDIDSPVKS